MRRCGAQRVRARAAHAELDEVVARVSGERLEYGRAVVFRSSLVPPCVRRARRIEAVPPRLYCTRCPRASCGTRWPRGSPHSCGSSASARRGRPPRAQSVGVPACAQVRSRWSGASRTSLSSDAWRRSRVAPNRESCVTEMAMSVLRARTRSMMLRLQDRSFGAE